MKKFLCLAASFMMVASLTGCGSDSSKDTTKTDDNAKGSKAEIVMLTDVGTIDDQSFNQGTWEGVEAYGEETGKEVAYIKPTEKSDNSYKESIDQAVNDYGAKVIVTPGYLFEPTIYEKQDQYPDVKFVLIDGYPNDGNAENPKEKVADNTVGIKYAENQSGYLAGYAVVKEGKTKLGFMGGIAVPAVVNYGYGFVQGANDAAKELGVSISLKYKYTGTFNPSPEIQSEAASWYTNGTEVIFACGGGIGNSVMAAAEANKGQVIGVDVDQSAASTTVLTSAYKQLAVSVKEQLKSIDDNTFKGGQKLVLGAGEDAIGLPMETSTFTTFTKEDYETIYAAIKDGSVSMKSNADVTDPTQLEVPSVTLEYIGN